VLHSKIKNLLKSREFNKKFEVEAGDPKYFSACFKKAFGMLPSDYADKI
jgi:YesN/AraC family two-component response regulator